MTELVWLQKTSKIMSCHKPSANNCQSLHPLQEGACFVPFA